MKWQSNKFPKKQILACCKFFDLPYYRKWKHEKHLKKRRLNKKVGRPRDPMWAKRKLKQLGLRDGLFCSNCFTEGNLTVDHIMPLWNGGTNKIENTIILCKRCHVEKERKENKERHKLSTRKS